MPFGYERPNGRWEEYNVDVNEILQMRYLSDPTPRWLSIAQNLDIPHGRMEQMRSSPQWRTAVERFLQYRGEEIHDEVLRHLGVKFPRVSQDEVVEQVVRNLLDIKFGVEIEFVSALRQTDVAQAVSEAGVMCRSEEYNHQMRNWWKVIYDGSIDSSMRNGSYGNCCEIVSPPMQGESGFEQIQKVCSVLNRIDCEVNRSCGLHVHVEANDLSIAQLRNVCTSWLRHEHVMEELIPHSRRGDANVYCKSNVRFYNGLADLISNVNRTRTRNTLCRTMCRQGRYYKMNVRSLSRHGTIEFRHHGGTMNSRKIRNHVKFCIGFLNHYKDVQNGTIDLALNRDSHWVDRDMPAMMTNLSEQLPESERASFIRYYNRRRTDLAA